jgi:hypothetical protein
MAIWKKRIDAGKWPGLPVLIVLLVLSGLACSLAGGAATPTPTSAGPCELVAGEQLIVYQRPSTLSETFSTLPSGASLPVEARTADGWLAFNPGVAQAANIGVFRYRWIDPSAGYSLQGDCQAVPEVVGPPPGICFTMPMEDVPVYDAPDTAATVLATLILEDYAAVQGLTSEGWARVDLAPGNLGLDIQGWIPSSTLNVNGPCESLPVLAP